MPKSNMPDTSVHPQPFNTSLLAMEKKTWLIPQPTITTANRMLNPTYPSTGREKTAMPAIKKSNPLTINHHQFLTLADTVSRIALITLILVYEEIGLTK